MKLDLGTISVDTDLSVTKLHDDRRDALNGPDTLTITGAFNWTGGDLDGAGTISVASGASRPQHQRLEFEEFDERQGNLTNQGTAIWSGTGQIIGNKRLDPQ